MTSNNAKTVLFGALIAAMILPFSMADPATAQTSRTIDEIATDIMALDQKLQDENLTSDEKETIKSQLAVSWNRTG